MLLCVSVCLGSQVLASGSVQIPRFTLLETGGLQIQPIVLGDAGNYTCYAANTEGTVDATSTLTVWSTSANQRLFIHLYTSSNSR